MLDEVIDIGLQAKTQFPAVILAGEIRDTDEDLVRLTLAGDESAFAEIFESHRRTVTAVVCRFFRDRSEIEEFVQQSFIKAYFSLKNYRGGEANSFPAWITRIAINVCYDEFRRRERRPAELFTDITDDETRYLETLADGRTPSADESLVAAQLVKKFLAGLDAADRVAMTLVYSEEYSLHEVAEGIGISTNTLKSRLFRCRNQIKARFGHLFT